MKGTRIPVALVLAGLTACGVPVHESASKVETKEVPFGLLDRDRGSTTTENSGEVVVVYMAKDDRLVPAARRLEPPVTLERVLDSLSNGPTEGEVAAGIRSALPSVNNFHGVSLSRGTASVDLARPFTALSSTDQILALAQLVYTLTSQPGIGLVRFTLQGASTEVPRANGSLTSARVSRDDYLAVAPAG